MHDISDLERRGVVGVFVASDTFADAAREQGEAIGFDVPHVLVPHPIQGRTDEEIQALADSAYEEIVRAVTAG